MIHIETLAERNDRYIREGRTVSGGDGNGPGKPGYEFLKLTDDWAVDEINLNARADKGYSFVAFIPGDQFGALLLANYKKD